MIQLGAFELHTRIGQGGMGEVWRATHVHDDRPVAVKVLSAEALRDPVYRSAFRNEVRAVASLRHPHIIRVYEHGEVGEREARQADHLVAGMSYLAMELADGRSLAARRGKLAWTEIRAVMLALLDALAHAHARDVIHRDVKPGNVLLGSSAPRIKLTDFGLAHALDRNFPWEASSTAGTPAYMAPEQFVGEWRDFGPWTDLYALGCVGWALTTGHPPFRTSGRMESMQAHLGREPGRFAARVPVPGGWEPLLRRLLEKDPKYRYQHAAAAAWDLQRLGDVEASPRLPDDPAARAIPRAVQRTTLVWPGVDPETPLPDLPLDWRRARVRAAPRPPGTGLGLFGLRSLPLVGREQERDRLWEALRLVHEDRRPAAVLLRGQAGAGKSRLAQWLRRRAHELGVATPLVSSHGANAPGGAGLERVVARWFQAVGSDPDELGYRVEVGLKSLGSEADPDEIDDLMALIGPWARQADHDELRLGGPGRRAVVTRFLHLLGLRGPVVWVLEDVQWAVDSLEFVLDVLRRGTASPPVLFVLTWREDFQGHEESAALVEAVRRHPRAVDLPVQPLSIDEIGELVGGLLGLEPDLAREVAERSEGNPLFAVQLVTDWVDRGALQAGPEGFRRGPGATRSVPDSLHQIWMDRLQRVLGKRHPDDRIALELAALLGAEVGTREWRDLCAQAAVEVSRGLLEVLLDHRLAVREEAGTGWAFAHGMLRESLIRSAEEAGRLRDHHRHCAEVLRRRPGHRSERVGRHLLAAGQAEEAITLLLDGAIRWVGEGDHSAADALLVETDRAIAEAAIPGKDRRRVQAWVLRSEVELLRGGLKQAARWARIAANVAEQYGWPDLEVRARLRLGLVFHFLGHPMEAESFLSDARRTAEDTGDRALKAETLAVWGSVWLLRGGAAEARSCFDRALALFGREGAEPARCVLGLGLVARLRGELEAARVYLDRARTMCEQAGRARGAADALVALADVARQSGYLEQGEALCLEARRVYDRYDLAHGALVDLERGLLMLAAGLDDDARPLLTAAAVALQGQGNRVLAAIARAGLLRSLATRGQWASFDRALAAALDVLEAARVRDPAVPWLLELAADAALRQGELERARHVGGLAAGRWERLGRPGEAAAVAARLAETG